MKSVWIKGATALMAVVLVASCGQPTAPEPDAEAQKAKADRYQYSLSEDAAGDYVLLDEVQVENWRLKHIFIAGPDAFEAWGKGLRDSAAAPLTLVFEDMDTPASDGKKRTLTLVPVEYDLSDDRLTISAVSGGVGEVRFDGKLDLDALAVARRNLGHEGVVLSGKLNIGRQTFDNARMKWWMGG